MRGDIILSAAHGIANHAIARNLATSVPTVLWWRKCFWKAGWSRSLKIFCVGGVPNRFPRKKAAMMQAPIKTKPRGVMPNRKVEILKRNGENRTLQIPVSRPRLQGAWKRILEAAFEADFAEHLGFRPKRSPDRA